jgi:hypothetical protein
VRAPLVIAADVENCASSWDECVRLIGNVRADELAFLARTVTELHATIMQPDSFNECDRMRLLAILEGDDL